MDKIVKEDRSEENLNNIRTIQVNSPHEQKHKPTRYTYEPDTSTNSRPNTYTEPDILETQPEPEFPKIETNTLLFSKSPLLR